MAFAILLGTVAAMRVVSYSDLHLEFQHSWSLPPDIGGDILVLAGDIITFKDFTPLAVLLRGWDKPVLFIAGNHEYYTRMPMQENAQQFRGWLAAELPHVTFLCNEPVTLDGVNFFGGTMWTDFKSGNVESMRYAAQAMNDFRYIRDNGIFTPEASIEHHQRFCAALEQWFEQKLLGPHVVITHHAPVANPNSQHLASPLQPAFVAYDMGRYIEKYAPALWIYGHSHECDSQLVGKTRILSNQLGYPDRLGGYECSRDFDNYGHPVEV